MLLACVGAQSPGSDGICDRVYFVSASFSGPERERVESANARWNAKGVERFCLITAENLEHGIRRGVYGSPEWQIQSNRIGKPLLGLYRGSDDQITLYVTNLNELELVAIHEIGHARGLKHVTDKTAIMHSSLGQETSKDFTPADMNECRRVDACLSDVQVLVTDSGERDCTLGS